VELAALVQNLDAALGLFEPRVTEAGELHATLVERQRLLERQIALLELLDDRFELGDGAFEIFDRRISHSVFDTLASISPRLKVTRTVSPGSTADASRSTRVLSAF